MSEKMRFRLLYSESHELEGTEGWASLGVGVRKRERLEIATKATNIGTQKTRANDKARSHHQQSLLHFSPTAAGPRSGFLFSHSWMIFTHPYQQPCAVARLNGNDYHKVTRKWHSAVPIIIIIIVITIIRLQITKQNKT